WSLPQPYSTANRWAWTPTQPGQYSVQVWVRNNGSSANYDAWAGSGAFTITASGTPLTVTSLTPNPTLPQPAGTPITWTATATGGVGPLQYAFYLYTGATNSWSLPQPYSTANRWAWTPTQPGQYSVQVWVRNNGSSANYDAWAGSGAFTISGPDAQFLSFPLPASEYPQGAYTPGMITSVLDHHMSTVYSDHDSYILSFTGELFQATAQYPITAAVACYPKVGNSTWSSLLSILYEGTGIGSGAPNDCSTNIALNYEAHPGYDYVAGTGTVVLAAAPGHVVSLNRGCVPKGMSEGCEEWGAIGVDHQNGYISQYLHLSSVLVSPGDPISEGQQIGLSGNTSPANKPVPPHLHFEVLRLRSGSSNDYNAGSYATVDPYGFDTSTGYLDYMTTFNGNLPNICLWKGGCKFQ
ncbi:MAG TPA: peptidoglycan DD-metalloendopeptidase family protein, partial [Candidatus Acidoferrum sp.]|nr:peptidoglycan DD-metalloendopeptidase family protein [Candidatus Acidoferrum sp.]